MASPPTIQEIASTARHAPRRARLIKAAMTQSGWMAIGSTTSVMYKPEVFRKDAPSSFATLGQWLSARRPEDLSSGGCSRTAGGLPGPGRRGATSARGARRSGIVRPNRGRARFGQVSKCAERAVQRG
jgi:hypothetical protein